MNLTDGSSQALVWWNALMRLPLLMSAESMRFMGRRCAAHAENLEKLARCANAREAAEVQGAFAQQMLKDYRDEAELVVREVKEVVPFARAA